MVELLDTINNRIYVPRLTRTRIIAAIAVAVVVDVTQFTQIPVLEQILDVVAAVATIWLLGFHLLLLPTFAVEFVPLLDGLPFWTGCVFAVIKLRGQHQQQATTEEPKKDLPPPEPPPKALE